VTLTHVLSSDGASLAASQAYLDRSGIRSWFNALDKLGVPTKDSTLNTHKGTWVLVGMLLLWPLVALTCLSLFGNITGSGDTAGTIPRSYPELLVELAIISTAGFLLYKMHTMKRY
jgi:hypothetical protein